MATLAPTRTWRAEGAEAVAPAKAREVREGWIKSPGKTLGIFGINSLTVKNGRFQMLKVLCLDEKQYTK